MTRVQANGMLLFAAFLWGAGNVAQKTVLADIGPVTTVGLRCLIASLVLAPFFARSHIRPTQDKIKCAAWVIATFGVAMTLYQVAAGLTTVTNAGFLVNICVVTTPLAAWILLRQKPYIVVWPAGFLSLIGAYMISGGLVSQFNIGDILAMAAAVCYSFWMVLLGRFVILYGQAGFITLAQFAVTGFVCLTIGLLIEPISFEGLGNALPELLMLGIVSTGLGYLLQAIAQCRASASEAAIIVSGEAIFGAIFAFVLLGEVLDSGGLLGAILILTGIGIVQLKLPINPPLSFLKEASHERL